MKHFFFVICLVLGITGCRVQKSQFNLEKKGLAYNYSEKAYFYYPKGWEVEEDTIKFSLDILNPKNREGFYLDAFDIDASNSYEELVNLYTTKLNTLGVDITTQHKAQLQNAQPCIFISGENRKDDTKFSEVVIIMDEKLYIYSYIAQADVYDEHISEMLAYLKTFSINESQKAV